MATTLCTSEKGVFAVNHYRLNTGQQRKRYLALDAYRGFIMLTLAAEGFGFSALKGDPTWGRVASWFRHVPWEGGVFWDMIQPAFMFMVGAAMPSPWPVARDWAPHLEKIFVTR